MILTPYKPHVYVAVVIQARLGSQRFPKKVLADVEGKPLLARVIERVKHVENCHAIIVASPDQECLDIAHGCGIWGVKGSEEDVLGRYIEAARFCNADVVVRITADCPLVDAALIDEVITALGQNDYAANCWKRTYPYGFEVEAFWTDVLIRINRLCSQEYHWEHVTTMIYDFPWMFQVASVEDKEDNSDLRMCVDYKRDLDLIRAAYRAMGDEYWGYEKLIEFAREIQREHMGNIATNGG